MPQETKPGLNPNPNSPQPEGDVVDVTDLITRLEALEASSLETGEKIKALDGHIADIIESVNQLARIFQDSAAS